MNEIRDTYHQNGDLEALAISLSDASDLLRNTRGLTTAEPDYFAAAEIYNTMILQHEWPDDFPILNPLSVRRLN